jgi:hypothetical protein
MRFKLNKEEKAKLKKIWEETKSGGRAFMKAMPAAARGFGTSAEMITKSFEPLPPRPMPNFTENVRPNRDKYLDLRKRRKSLIGENKIRIPPQMETRNLILPPNKLRRNPFAGL